MAHSDDDPFRRIKLASDQLRDNVDPPFLRDIRQHQKMIEQLGLGANLGPSAKGIIEKLGLATQPMREMQEQFAAISSRISSPALNALRLNKDAVEAFAAQARITDQAIGAALRAASVPRLDVDPQLHAALQAISGRLSSPELDAARRLYSGNFGEAVRAAASVSEQVRTALEQFDNLTLGSQTARLVAAAAAHARFSDDVTARFLRDLNSAAAIASARIAPSDAPFLAETVRILGDAADASPALMSELLTQLFNLFALFWSSASTALEQETLLSVLGVALTVFAMMTDRSSEIVAEQVAQRQKLDQLLEGREASALEHDGERAIVRRSALVRPSAQDDAKPIDRLTHGDRVQILGADGRQMKVRYFDYLAGRAAVGWIHSSRVMRLDSVGEADDE